MYGIEDRIEEQFCARNDEGLVRFRKQKAELPLLKHLMHRASASHFAHHAHPFDLLRNLRIASEGGMHDCVARRSRRPKGWIGKQKGQSTERRRREHRKASQGAVA